MLVLLHSMLRHTQQQRLLSALQNYNGVHVRQHITFQVHPRSHEPSMSGEFSGLHELGLDKIMQQCFPLRCTCVVVYLWWHARNMPGNHKNSSPTCTA